MDTLVLRRYPRLDTQKKNQLCPTLNHTGSVHATDASDEDMHPIKETYSFPEVTSSPYET